MMSFSYRVTIRWKLDFTPDMNDVMLQQKMILQNDDLKCHCFLVWPESHETSLCKYQKEFNRKGLVSDAGSIALEILYFYLPTSHPGIQELVLIAPETDW